MSGARFVQNMLRTNALVTNETMAAGEAAEARQLREVLRKWLIADVTGEERVGMNMRSRKRRETNRAAQLPRSVAVRR